MQGGDTTAVGTNFGRYFVTQEEAIALANRAVEPDVLLASGRGLGYRLGGVQWITDRDFSEQVRAPYWYIRYDGVRIGVDGVVELTGRHPMCVAVEDATGAMGAIDFV